MATLANVGDCRSAPFAGVGAIIPQLGKKAQNIGKHTSNRSQWNHLIVSCVSMDAAEVDHFIETVQTAEFRERMRSFPDSEQIHTWRFAGLLLRQRWEEKGVESDLDHGIQMFEQVIAFESNTGFDRNRDLDTLSSLFEFRFHNRASVEDLNRAILTREEGLVLLPDNDPRRVTSLGILAGMLFRRFELAPSDDDLNRVISATENVILLTPDDDPILGNYLQNLKDVLLIRFRRTESLADLDQLIATIEKKASMGTHGDSSVLVDLYDLGHALETRFKMTLSSRPNDLNQAIELYEQASVLTEGKNLKMYFSLPDWEMP